MEKTILKNISFCDCCGKEEEYLTKCRSCGEGYCHECCIEKGEKYSSMVFFTTSDDGFYCNKCNYKLSENPDERFKAFKEIKKLKEEYRKWVSSFDKRCKAVESIVNDLRSK